MSYRTIARSALAIAVHVLKDTEDASHRCFRVKNLLAEEVRHFVDLWPAVSTRPAMANVRLVSADSANGAIPEAFVAEPGRSITYYRNNNPGGLVYLETKVQSDEQGLQNLFTLRDSNFLDGSFDKSAGGEESVSDLIVQVAWDVTGVSGSDDKAPRLLVSLIKELLSILHPELVPIPVRRFATFAEAVAAQWRSSASAFDAEAATSLIGTNLWLLGLFPDTSWRSTVSEARTRRRLTANSRFADLASASGDLDTDLVVKRIQDTKFNNASGNPFPDAAQGRLRMLCTDYVQSPSVDKLRLIEFFVFEQLFALDSVGQPLGERVANEVSVVDATRLAELLALDVTAGLNAKVQSDAERLVGAEPVAPHKIKVFDLLTAATKRLVERVATPRVRRFFNPCIEVVRFYNQAAVAGERIGRIELQLSAGVRTDSPSIGLFAFLFAGSLRAVQGSIEGLPSSCELVLSEDLVRQRPIPGLIAEPDADYEDEEDAAIEWEELALRFTAFGCDGSVIEVADQVRWASNSMDLHAMFWLLVVDAQSPISSRVGSLRVAVEDDPAQWHLRYVQRIASLGSLKSNATNPLDSLCTEVVKDRELFCSTARSDGLSAELLNAYGDLWRNSLARARETYIPSGRHISEMDAFLTSDFLVVGPDGRRVMLPTHPIRLRWLACYLGRCVDVLVACLSGDLMFSHSDGSDYLAWLEDHSPHESPAIAVDEQGTLLYATGEVGWFEEFGVLDNGVAEVSSDRYALESIAGQVTKYLEAHPYKESGLSMLAVLPSSDDFPAALLELTARGRWRNLRASMTVAAPKGRWEAIARKFEQLDRSDSAGKRAGLFPRFDLTFVEFDRGGDIAGAIGDADFDLSIVTHILQDSVLCQPNTEAPSARPGRFDPLLDRPVRLDKQSDGGSISVVMRPRDPDPLLEAWSTLVVRANRTRPVAPDQPENIDFVELRVNFEDSARLFNALHQASHWVITLERHISRQQIESTEAGAPDVLSIQDQIGNNGLSTLIVSSSSGRRLIESRIARKLNRLVPHDREAGASLVLASLASRIYDETRRIAPHLALRAMGISRVTEEILGLYVARSATERLFPAKPDDGFRVWLSLDDHATWFGGHGQVRPDMCRLCFERTADGCLFLDVVVLEGKLRQQYDAHGVDQVLRGILFFSEVLGHQSVRDRIDSEMWRERILAAIESTAIEARHVFGVPVDDKSRGGTIPADIRTSIREGHFTLRSLTGVYCITLWDELDVAEQVFDERGVTIVRAAGRSLFSVTSSSQTSESSVIPKVSAVESSVRAKLVNTLPTSVTETSDTLPLGAFGGSTTEFSSPAPLIASTPADVVRLRMTNDDLLRIYSDVLGCFAEHDIQVSRASDDDVPFVEGPASILFRVKPGHGVDPKKLSEKAAALKLSLRLSEEQNVAFGIDAGYVTIDVPKSSAQRYFVPADAMWSRWNRPRESLEAPLGEDRFGKIISICFSSPNSPHLLVGGTTGSGKSEALNTILFGLCHFYAASELRLLLVDPKGTELAPFESSPYLHGSIGWDDGDALSLLKEAVEEMQRRYVLFKALGTRTISDYNAVASGERLPWWVIVLDEYADLTNDAQAKKDIEQELKRLAQKARASGIHLIIATQKPSADVISTNLRSNLPAQLGLRVKSATESRVLIDEAGAEVLNGKGDALLKADGRVVRVQCARVAIT